MIDDTAQQITEAAERGVPLYLGEERPDPESYGEESVVDAEFLSDLLTSGKNSVHRRGLVLRGACIAGDLDLVNARIEWPVRIEDSVLLGRIRASHMVLVALSLRGSHLYGEGDPTLLDLEHVRISGDLQLDGDFAADGMITIAGAKIGGQLNCRNGTIKATEGDDALFAQSAEVTSNVLLDEGFAATGTINLVGARIGGQLSCRGGRITASKSECALNAQSVHITSDLFLDEKFAATGSINLAGATIGGLLSFAGGTITAAKNAEALSAQSAAVTGDVLFDKSIVTGTINLAGAKIGGQLSCRGGTITAARNADALFASPVEVTSNVLLDEGFAATGAVNLMGAKIGGQLSCRGGRIAASTKSHALNAESAEITSELFLDEGFVATGTINLAGAKIGGQLSCIGGIFEAASERPTVDLTSVSLGMLTWREVSSCRGELQLFDCHTTVLDDDEASWNLDGMTYDLHGFSYDRLSSSWRTEPSYQPGATSRYRAGVSWLAGSLETGIHTYRQLAGLYRSQGHDVEAREVMVAANHNQISGWRRILGVIGYGYHPERALLIALPWLILLTAAVSWGNEKMLFQTTADNAPTLQPLVYSIEVMTPIIDLGQRQYWVPDSTTEPWGMVLAWLVWLSIILGWTLTTMVVAGFSNLIRRE